MEIKLLNGSIVDVPEMDIDFRSRGVVRLQGVGNPGFGVGATLSYDELLSLGFKDQSYDRSAVYVRSTPEGVEDREIR